MVCLFTSRQTHTNVVERNRGFSWGKQMIQSSSRTMGSEGSPLLACFDCWYCSVRIDIISACFAFGFSCFTNFMLALIKSCQAENMEKKREVDCGVAKNWRDNANLREPAASSGCRPFSFFVPEPGDRHNCIARLRYPQTLSDGGKLCCT